MKILTKNKIIESYHFPFSEALIFSILVWCSWGLAEAFYLDRISLLLDRGKMNVDSLIYLQSFFIYLGVAAFTGTLLYIGVRIILAIFHLHNTMVFRAVTLCSILALFFCAAFFYGIIHLTHAGINTITRNIILVALILFGIGVLIFLYFRSSSPEFRIRRSGTMMLSLLVIFLLLSFVDFPIFSNKADQAPEQPGYKMLLAYHFISPLIGK